MLTLLQAPPPLAAIVVWGVESLVPVAFIVTEAYDISVRRERYVSEREGSEEWRGGEAYGWCPVSSS